MRLHTLLLSLLLLAVTLPSAAAAHRGGSATSGAYSLELVDESGRTLPTYQHRGRTYVRGHKGQRYQLRVRNQSGVRVEVVASVDGRDVLDGKPSAMGKRGYLVPAWGHVVIDGFRLSDAEVAAFRFSKVKDSYAARMGDARDVGVIGVAVFPERPVQTYAYHDPHPYRDSAPMDAPSAPSASSGAPAPSAEANAPSRGGTKRSERPGLGTEFGEAHSSHVTTVEFVRARSTPDAVLTVRYNDREGLLALGIDVDGSRRLAEERRLRETADPFRRDPGYATPPPGWR